jgi:hypothetical protein
VLWSGEAKKSPRENISFHTARQIWVDLLTSPAPWPQSCLSDVGRQEGLARLGGGGGKVRVRLVLRCSGGGVSIPQYK